MLPDLPNMQGASTLFPKNIIFKTYPPDYTWRRGGGERKLRVSIFWEILEHLLVPVWFKRVVGG